jgi:general secretion pathway protein M
MSTMTTRWAALIAPMHAAWAQRQPRERQLIALLAWLMALAVMWQVALAPALQTLHDAPARQASLDAQTQKMRTLQAEALSLKKPTPITRSEATRWLESSVAETLGAGTRISVQGERATLTLQAAPAAELARWLSQARERAQALPVQAQLQQATATAAPTAKASNQTPSRPAPTSADAGVRWNGSVVLSLP